MKQIGNLAIVVAKYPEVKMQIFDETIVIHTDAGKKTITCHVWDDDYINEIIAFLNYGKISEQICADFSVTS